MDESIRGSAAFAADDQAVDVASIMEQGLVDYITPELFMALTVNQETTDPLFSGGRDRLLPYSCHHPQPCSRSAKRRSVCFG